MRTIFRLVRWFGKALDRDGIGWAGFWLSVLVALLLGGMLDCFRREATRIEYDRKMSVFRDEAVRRGEMEVWRTPDGENIYRWKE